LKKKAKKERPADGGRRACIKDATKKGRLPWKGGENPDRKGATSSGEKKRVDSRRKVTKKRGKKRSSVIWATARGKELLGGGGREMGKVLGSEHSPEIILIGG